MANENYEIIKKANAFKGYFSVERYTLKHRLFDEGWSGEFTREVFERGHAASVVLYDPLLDNLVLIEQFRPGAVAAAASPWFGDDFSPWLVETVAGIIDKGESPEGVAIREAKEEAGCEVSALIPVCHYLVSPGGSSESMFIFCGRVDSTKVGGHHGNAAENEYTNARVVPAQAAFQMLDQGRIMNSMTLIGLMWFRTNRHRVRATMLGADVPVPAEPEADTGETKETKNSKKKK
jgi:ADP-ribose pyrophosphatase